MFVGQHLQHLCVPREESCKCGNAECQGPACLGLPLLLVRHPGFKSRWAGWIVQVLWALDLLRLHTWLLAEVQDSSLQASSPWCHLFWAHLKECLVLILYNFEQIHYLLWPDSPHVTFLPHLSAPSDPFFPQQISLLLSSLCLETYWVRLGWLP